MSAHLLSIHVSFALSSHACAHHENLDWNCKLADTFLVAHAGVLCLTTVSACCRRNGTRISTLLQPALGPWCPESQYQACLAVLYTHADLKGDPAVGWAGGEVVLVKIYRCSCMATQFGHIISKLKLGSLGVLLLHTDGLCELCGSYCRDLDLWRAAAYSRSAAFKLDASKQAQAVFVKIRRASH